ncbi:hypothetical protein LTR97_008455 [Elasticomyces elasticus]|uniref:Uncharacterized protein n=1 Tax=Elasticomyces elasticus TaxID=574655 RepID=A0AAN7W566_9PEZI|nr:hypothetical protein LTR97_008455 [Elasticomyces elasticus]KAK5719363.1 hypothetical protein LTR15_007886 [Elasticomyces elasticus]
MPYGRGGAGNILAVEQEKARVSNDVEANRQAVDPSLTSTGHEEQKYAHSGRGGAGNYYSPQDLSQTGVFSDAHRSHVLGDGTQAPSGSAPPSYTTTTAPTSGSNRTVGRGGAGNWGFGSSESEERAAREKAEEDERRKQVQAEVEKKVESALAEPPKAKLAGNEPF